MGALTTGQIVGIALGCVAIVTLVVASAVIVLAIKGINVNSKVNPEGKESNDTYEMASREETHKPPVDETQIPSAERTQIPPAQERTQIPPVEQTGIPPVEQTGMPPAELTNMPSVSSNRLPPLNKPDRPDSR